MVQAQGPRREHRPRPRVARSRAPPPGPDIDKPRRPGRASRRGHEAHNYDQVDDFYAAIGYGAVGPAGRHAPRRRGRRHQASADGRAAHRAAPDGRGQGQGRRRPPGPVRQCASGPGDVRSSAFVTRGKGVTVHLQSCPTVINERELGRLIEVEWEAEPTQTYPIAIRVEAYDRTGLLNDITQVVAENKVNILAAQVAVTPISTAVVTATLQVHSVSQLARVMSRIETLKDVINVQRDLG